jgi:SAM-dependent methyltransferase
MRSFDLARRFDAVTCLFSSIGYTADVPGLRAAIAAMARHLEPGGVLVLEPWLEPGQWIEGRPHVVVVDEPDLKIARMNVSTQEGRLAIMHFHYLVGTPEGVQYFDERHEAALFTGEEYRAAFAAAGLEVEHDAEGLIGRGLYVGVAPG